MPLGELRRKDRELNAEEAELCLLRGLVGHIGTVGTDGMPYVVPINYVYDHTRRSLFLHCATSGHLLDNIAHSNLACFEVDEPGKVVLAGPRPCDTTHLYESVICFGRARIIRERQEKREALNLFVRKYVDQLMPERQYDPTLATVDSTVVIEVQVEKMTGKRRPPLREVS